MKLYAIFDRVAGTFGEPTPALKDELAIRKFNYVMANSPMVSSDCDLYALCDYDMDTGCISIPELGKPVFVCRYEAKPI